MLRMVKTLIFTPTLPFFYPKPIFFTSLSPHKLSQFPIIPSISSPSLRLFATCSSNGSSSSSSGEVHVIVGPMFAGKTSTLLTRVQSLSSLGSFQAIQNKSSPLLLDKTLKTLCYTGRLKEAIRLLCGTSVVIDWKTYALLLQECIHQGSYQWGKIIHAHMVLVGFDPNEYLKTKLLILYSKSGDLRSADVLFHKLLEKRLVSWNAVIAGYVQNGHEDTGLSLYYKMRHYGMIPDQFTFSSVFRACAMKALLEQGKQVHGVMVKCRIGQNLVVHSALMDMYFKCSSPNAAYRVFDKCMQKNVVTWTSLISGYGQNGRVYEVLELFHKMVEEGVGPNFVTFISVLSACSHGGLVDEGWKYFHSMQNDYGITPIGKHYATMVDMLGRAGKLEEAYKFVSTSPCKDNPVVWGALLGACKIHGNVELLKIAASRYFELEPDNAGKYVVLSNSYANYGLWDDVAQVRGFMRDSGVKKDPGYSRIEIQNEVHFFFKGDNTHKDSRNTYEVLKELTCVIVDYGYVPDLNCD